MCRAWRDWLSPASLPIQELSLGGYQGGELDGNDDARELKRIMAFAQWVSRTQPTARRIYVCLSGSDLEPSDPLAAAVLTALASIQPRTVGAAGLGASRARSVHGIPHEQTSVAALPWLLCMSPASCTLAASLRCAHAVSPLPCKGRRSEPLARSRRRWRQ